MPMRSVADTATEWAFSAGWSAVKYMPEPAADALFRTAADRMWRRRGPSVVQLERNLLRVDPRRSDALVRHLSRGGMRSYLRYWCEAFRLPAWSRERISGTFTIEGKEDLDRYMRTGRGVVMVPGHTANWDHAGAWACLEYGGITTVAERLKPEGLFDQFVAYRETLGMEVLAHGDPQIVQNLARRLRDGRLLALLGDRDLTKHGIRVSLFGQEASFPAGPALLGLMTGAPVIPVSMWFDGEYCRARMHDPVRVPKEGSRRSQIASMVQQIADGLAQGIAEHPQDWHMLQKVWLADLDPARRAALVGG